MNSYPPLICCHSAHPHAAALTTIPHSPSLPQRSFLPLHPLCHASTCPCVMPLFASSHPERGGSSPEVFLSSFIFLEHLCFCSLSLRASRECQNKERLLEQRFRAALRDFQQWLVNAKISTAKCFDVPQNVAEASNALQRIQVRDLSFPLDGPCHGNLRLHIFDSICKFQPFSVNQSVAARAIVWTRYPGTQTTNNFD